MGGAPKGLLRGPGGLPLVVRAARALESVGCYVVLVGEHPAYRALGLPTIADAETPRVGPLGGLVALLRAAPKGAPVLALACDMPFVSERFLRRLLEEDAAAPALAPRRDGRWEPLCARYRPDATLALAQSRLAHGAHALQGLLDAIPATELRVSAAEAAELNDWDHPEDVPP